MTEKTKRKNDVTRSRRPLAVGLITLLILVGMTGLMLTSLSAQADPTGHLYYGYTIDPTTEAFYRVDLAAGGSEYQPWPLPKETTVGYEAPPPRRQITGEVVWKPEANNGYELIIQEPGTGTLRGHMGRFYADTDFMPQASYSPDGEWFVFGTFSESVPPDQHDRYPQELGRVRTNLGAWQRLTDTSTDERHPTFTMDGTSVLYLSDADGRQRLYQMDLASQTSRLLAPELGTVHHYVWSPDDQQIAVLSSPSETFTDDTSMSSVTLSLLNPVTGAVSPLLSDRIYDLIWSPDSQWLAYATYDPMETLAERSYGGIMGIPSTPFYDEAPSSLWIIRTDGTDKQLISGARMPLHGFDWIP